jgi:hypothetical protein
LPHRAPVVRIVRQCLPDHETDNHVALQEDYVTSRLVVVLAPEDSHHDTSSMLDPERPRVFSGSEMVDYQDAESNR